MWRASPRGVLAILILGTNVSWTFAASHPSLGPSLVQEACTAAAVAVPKDSSANMHTSDHLVVEQVRAHARSQIPESHDMTGYRILGPGDIEPLHPASRRHQVADNIGAGVSDDAASPDPSVAIPRGPSDQVGVPELPDIAMPPGRDPGGQAARPGDIVAVARRVLKWNRCDNCAVQVGGTLKPTRRSNIQRRRRRYHLVARPMLAPVRLKPESSTKRPTRRGQTRVPLRRGS